MKNFHKIDPQHLVIREGGGCLSIFGLPFFCAGIFLFLAGIGVMPFENADEVPSFAYLVLILMSLAFTGVGGGLLFGRSLTVVDLTQGRIIKQMGLLKLVFLKRAEYFLENYNAVKLCLDAGDSDSPDTYPIFLKHFTIQEDLKMFTAMSYADGLKYSAALAAFIRFSLEDCTTDHAMVIEPDQLGQTIRVKDERFERQETFQRPLDMKSRVEQIGRLTKILIPGNRYGIGMFLPFFIPLVIFIAFGPAVVEFFEKTETPKIVQDVFGGVALLMFLGFPLMTLISDLIGVRRGGTTVILGQDEITVEVRCGWSTKRVRFSVGDIIGLDYSVRSSLIASLQDDPRYKKGRGTDQDPARMYEQVSNSRWFKALERLTKSKGITLKTKQGLYSFAMGLPDEEVQYLYQVVRDFLGK